MARMCLAQGIKQMADLINCPEAGLFLVYHRRMKINSFNQIVMKITVQPPLPSKSSLRSGKCDPRKRNSFKRQTFSKRITAIEL